MDTIIDRQHACAFTGHRPERLGIPEADVIAWLEKEIRKATEDRYTQFITGMQRGVDLWAAETVLKLKAEGKPLRLIAASALQDEGTVLPSSRRRPLPPRAQRLRACLHATKRRPSRGLCAPREGQKNIHAAKPHTKCTKMCYTGTAEQGRGTVCRNEHVFRTGLGGL